MIYLDNVIIYSKTFEYYISPVHEIHTALKVDSAKRNISMFSFFSATVEYLCQIIRPGTLEVMQVNTKSLKNAKPLTIKTERRSLLGLCNVYRRFISNFTDISAPLNKLLRKYIPESLEFDDEQTTAFHKFIEISTSPPILPLPHPDLPDSIDTDASNYAIVVTLFQTHSDEIRKPIRYVDSKEYPSGIDRCSTTISR